MRSISRTEVLVICDQGFKDKRILKANLLAICGVQISSDQFTETILRENRSFPRGHNATLETQRSALDALEAATRGGGRTGQVLDQVGGIRNDRKFTRSTLVVEITPEKIKFEIILFMNEGSI